MKRFVLPLLGALALTASAQTAATYFPVVYPAQQEAVGEANVSTPEEGVYTLSNNLFEARFALSNSKLRFEGCSEMHLLGDTELFSVWVGNPAVATPASAFDVERVWVEDLTANPEAVRGSAHFAGKALCADLRHGNLKIAWRAVLRDGSHYLRTEMELMAIGSNVKFQKLVPMQYTVDAKAAGSAPLPVGNTRGQVIVSDCLFAGLETPMAFNTSVPSTRTDLVAEVKSHWKMAWTPETWKAYAAETLPAQLTALGFSTSNVKQYTQSIGVGEPDELTVTFNYKSGSHRINTVGVDLLDAKGNVVASDYHVGYAGNQKSNNTYTFNVPSAGTFTLRLLAEDKTETITSSGEAVAQMKNHVEYVPQEWSDTWKAADWQQVAEENVPARVNELGFYSPNVWYKDLAIEARQTGFLNVAFLYKSGNNRLNICAVELIDENGSVAASDYHNGYTGHQKDQNVYSMEVVATGNYTLRYYVQNASEAINSTGNIAVILSEKTEQAEPTTDLMDIEGMWSRNTQLTPADSWKVSAVVGIIAPGQARRSFLAYSERERAVPWRAYPCYINWFELGINRNNAPDYVGNSTSEQCVDVMQQWKTNLYDKYNEAPMCFMFDDGWDEYGTWTFNPNFPNGFRNEDNLARLMGTGIGAWLGPVGGYGQSGNYRRAYWNGKGGMQLSNPAYYEVFRTAAKNLTVDQGYDFRFFKFDGISAQFTSVGPDAGDTGNENAEGIIRLERLVRETMKEDIYFNTTVGTWASPFWYQFTDATWRQENDYGTIGNNSIDRENWITYRDRLVYQNYVQRSPICPINTIMTHGFILSKFGSVSKNMEYENVLREMRCAFVCGSGLVELYNDYSLMNSINKGQLWADLAECIQWQRRNADVLPDAHWVGGNPWNGGSAEVYGWASWNGYKATLALRNGANKGQNFKTTLRKALDIPEAVKGTITLTKSFASQAELRGLTVGEPIDIDAQLSLNLASSTLFCFDGVCNTNYNELVKSSDETGIAQPQIFPNRDADLYDLSGRQLQSCPQNGIVVKGGKKIMMGK